MSYLLYTESMWNRLCFLLVRLIGPVPNELSRFGKGQKPTQKARSGPKGDAATICPAAELLFKLRMLRSSYNSFTNYLQVRIPIGIYLPVKFQHQCFSELRERTRPKSTENVHFAGKNRSRPYAQEGSGIDPRTIINALCRWQVYEFTPAETR